MNRRVGRSGLVFLSVLSIILLYGCSTATWPSGYSSHCGVPPLRISVPPCFKESREGEACEPQQVAKTEQVVEAAPVVAEASTGCH
jgi:hypothetical protein